MRPASALVYNNFNTYEWLDYHLSTDFNGGNEGIGITRPSLSEFYAVTSCGGGCKKRPDGGCTCPDDNTPKAPALSKMRFIGEPKGNYGTNNLNRSKYNYPIHNTVVDSSKHNFSNVAGKGKLCKGAGLTGAEKRACKKNIKATCGRKPMFGRAKKEKWATCAGSNVVTPEQSAQEAVDKLVPTREGEGLSTGAKVAIGVGVVGFLALVGLAIANKKKAQPAMIQQPVRR